LTTVSVPSTHPGRSYRIYEPGQEADRAERRPANDHDHPRMSRQIIRLIHAETHVEEGVSAA
jgi:hypothetical protein